MEEERKREERIRERGRGKKSDKIPSFGTTFISYISALRACNTFLIVGNEEEIRGRSSICLSFLEVALNNHPFITPINSCGVGLKIAFCTVN